MTEQGGMSDDNYFRNQHGVLSVGRHVCMFVVDDTVKTKRFFVQQRKSYRSSRLNREFFTFYGGRDLYLSFLQVRIVIVFTSILI